MDSPVPPVRQMSNTTMTPLVNPPTPEERLLALEFFLGETLLALESDSAAIRAKLARLESAVERISPNTMPAPTDEDENNPAFTIESLGGWMQFCVERMRAHQAVSARHMVAIGEVTSRILALGGGLTDEPPFAIDLDAQAALEKAKRPLPPG